jgi:P-type Cu2+ transporter
VKEPREENCEHCGLGLGTAPLVAGERRFCCEGCRTVYEALAECSLLAYYEQREGKGLRVQSASSEVDYLDDPAFLREHAEALGVAGHWRAEMLVEGLHCSACVWVIERLPMVLPGVSEARLSYADGRLEVSWDSSKVKLSEIARALIRFGYTPHISAGGVSRKKQQSVERRLLVRIGVAGAAFGNVMLLGLSLYSGDAHGMSSEYTEFFAGSAVSLRSPRCCLRRRRFLLGLGRRCAHAHRTWTCPSVSASRQR